jgi:hypothetical protein
MTTHGGNATRYRRAWLLEHLAETARMVDRMLGRPTGWERSVMRAYVETRLSYVAESLRRIGDLRRAARVQGLHDEIASWPRYPDPEPPPRIAAVMPLPHRGREIVDARGGTSVLSSSNPRVLA